VTVGHVDESALFPGCEDGVQRILQAEDVQVVTARLEDVFDSEEGLELVEKTVTPGAVRDKFVAQIVRQDPGVSPRERLKQLFSGLSTATNREDMLDSIKTFLIKKLAQSCGCRTLLLGDSGTRMATKVVTYTSRGRGYSLPFEVLGESQWGDIAVFRPMREWIAKEVAFFNRWTAQPSAVVPTFTTGAPAKASIDRLTESFIVALDRDFPSTVATICKTVTKLQPQDDAADAVHCLVCGMPAEAGAQTWRNRLTVSDVSSTESEGPVAAGAKPEPEPETKLAAG
ncbi:Cytoplasmic tRNA 2-thiolation protein 2, partial [Linderina pennispora]